MAKNNNCFKNCKKKRMPFNVFSKKGLTTLAIAGVMAFTPFMAGCSGTPGDKGDTGAAGKSAYELAVENGFEGTLQEWLDSLKGQSGGAGSAGDPGRGITSIAKTGTNGLVDTYTITFSDGTTTTFDITNGASGTSSNTYVRYANVLPTSDADMLPEGTAGDYIGVYVGGTAPASYSSYTWHKIKGEKGEEGDIGPQGPQGNPGKDGISSYVGYDGYIWNGTNKTEFKVEDVTLGETVVENTIGIEGYMSKYFEGSYIDLSSNTVALMANYMASANVTQYSGTKITQLKVVAEEAGNLYIGTAKVADIVNARTNGTTYTSSTTAHEVTAGLNTITLELNVAEDETIVIGGQNSVGLYHAQGITTNDEHGNYTLIDGTTHTEVISETSDIQDTLAIQVSAKAYANTQLFSDASSKFEQTPSAIFNSNYKMNYSPYTYQNSNYFAGKHITRIGIPVLGVKAIDENQTLTIYTFDKSLVGQVVKENQTSGKYQVKLPVEELQGATYSEEKGYYVVDKWIYVDVDIQVGSNETIAWGEYDPNYDDTNTMVTTDTIYWGLTTQNIDTNYIVYGTLGDDTVVSGSSMNMLFDFYEIGEISFEEHLEILKKKDKLALLQNVLAENNIKNFSILGDSISTYKNYTDVAGDINTNLAENNAYYQPEFFSDINQTWWMQFAKDADIDIVVNNSSGGRNVDEAYEACLNLHDNIGENSGTNPDMIAIYLGINDYQNKEGYLGSIADINWDTLIVKEGSTYSYATPTTFCEAYAILMHKTQTAYANADIFAFTLVPNNTRIARGFDTTMEESIAYLREYNDAIGGLKDELKTRYDIEVHIVDLFNNTGITIENFTEYNCDPNAYFTLSSLHPNEAGMDLITECLIDAVIEKYSNN